MKAWNILADGITEGQPVHTWERLRRLIFTKNTHLDLKHCSSGGWWRGRDRQPWRESNFIGYLGCFSVARLLNTFFDNELIVVKHSWYYYVRQWHTSIFGLKGG